MINKHYDKVGKNMVKWKEITEQTEVDEHKKVSPLTDWILTDRVKDLSKSTLVGKISSVEGQLDIYEEISLPAVVFRVVKDNEVIGYRTLKKREDTEYYQGKNSYLLPEYRKKGIASELLLWVLNNRPYKILSDYEMSDDGEKLLLSMEKHGKLHVLDTASGKQELWADNGKNNTMDPRLNNKFNDDYPENPEDINRKRIFWLLEGYVHKIITLEESGNLPKFGVYNKSLLERAGLDPFIQPYRHFGPGDP
jgi:GNAT superfamily N-acetyltransferase